MERESFEDQEVAEILNKNYVSIKVDREERPDIDTIYMSVCQALTGSGGWPLTVFLTPDAKPFYAGTYFPKLDRMGLPGIITVLEHVTRLWETDRETLVTSSESILESINREEKKGGTLAKKDDLFNKAFQSFRYSFDSSFGGFGNAPKFPTPHNLLFLLRYWFTQKEDAALSMVEKTLESMYRGGIFDHIGYGFSRYSTDRKWLAPHFEKMLYDNALLARVYLEAYKLTGKEMYADVARKIFTYVLRDMTSPEGAFYSAEDADSEGEEGKFYVWTKEEILQIFGDKDGERFARLYDITEAGNFESKNIPNLIAIKLGNEEEVFAEKCRQTLFDYRDKRIHPFKDDKILCAWNGLMIAALAYGGRILGDSSYVVQAEKAFQFLESNMKNKEGRLLARYRQGEAGIPAYSEDYAFVVWGLLELYDATFKPEYLKKAIEYNNDLLKLFWDETHGGLFHYGNDAEKLVSRPKEIYDGAIPSGNSVATQNFLRLTRLAGDSRLEEIAQKQFEYFNRDVSLSPHAYSFFLVALFYSESKSKEVIIAGDFDLQGTQDMIQILQKNQNPLINTLVYTDKQKELGSIIPYVKNYKAVDGKATAYVCEDFACLSPITDLGELENSIYS